MLAGADRQGKERATVAVAVLDVHGREPSAEDEQVAKPLALEGDRYFADKDDAHALALFPRLTAWSQRHAGDRGCACG